MWWHLRFITVIVSITIYLLFSNTNSVNGEDETNLNATEGTKFYLYTRENPLNYEQIQLDDSFYLKYKNFKPNKFVKILIHGWKGSYKCGFNIVVKNALLTYYDVNVIVVDWNEYSKLFYTNAKKYVHGVAEQVALLVNNLITKFSISPNNIHIIGHSLGAHVAGIAGKMTIKKINRVTGLDPAGPFYHLDDKDRISQESAQFVDIIHTDGGMAGFYHSLGHVDFYPNGGIPIQPGCGYDISTLRSHRRAYWLFAESITTPNGFFATSCESWEMYKLNNCNNNNVTRMGQHVSLEATGKYFLRTNDRTPFAIESSLENVL